MTDRYTKAVLTVVAAAAVAIAVKQIAAPVRNHAASTN